MFKKLLPLMAALTVSLLTAAPAMASSLTNVWPEQVAPGATEVFTFAIRNDLADGFHLDNIIIHQAAGLGPLFASSVPAPNSGYSTSEYRYGASTTAAMLNVAAGGVYVVKITASTTGTGLGTGNWHISEVGWARHTDGTIDTGDNRVKDNYSTTPLLAGTYGLTVTTLPVNPPQPLSSLPDSSQSDSINATGITDPSTVHGWLLAGPLDSLLVLPISLTSEIIDSDVGLDESSAPTFTLLGYTGTLPTGTGDGSIWAGMGDTFTALVSAAMVFFILLVWIKSLFHRLQRASSMDTHPDDTWGVL